jgi:hypothetical protein
VTDSVPLFLNETEIQSGFELTSYVTLPLADKVTVLLEPEYPNDKDVGFTS